MFLVGLLLTVLLAPQDVAPASGGFHPDERLTLPGGPEVAIFRSLPPGVASLRLSVPIQESRAEAGAAQILQIQAQDRMGTLAARIGARAEVHRTPQALVYEVSGATADLDFLGWILREGLRAPPPADFDGARRRLRSENERRLDTPQGVLYGRVREALAPDLPSITGSEGSLDRMDPERLHALWARSHRRENLRLVVAGRIPTELVLASLADLGLPQSGVAVDPPPGEETGSPRPNPEVNRHWVVTAYPLAPGSDAEALVAARWMAELLPGEAAEFEVGVEIWDAGSHRALVVSGAAFPRVRSAMEQRIGSLLAEAAARLTEDDVRRLADQSRTEILLAARTPWGLTELVGQAWDAGHGPEGVERLMEDLHGLTHAQVSGLLLTLADASPVREELRP